MLSVYSRLGLAEAGDVARSHPSARPQNSRTAPLRVAIVTSLHRDFDMRIWRHARLTSTLAETHLVCGWAVPNGTVRENVTLHTFRYSYSRLTRLRNIVGVLARLLPLLPKIDIIHFHDIDLLPVMIPLAAVRPVIYDVHENYADEMLVRTWIPGWLRRTLYHVVRGMHSLASRTIGNIVCVVPDQTEEFRTAKRVVLIENFASCDRAHEWRNDYLQRQPAVISTAWQYPANGTWVLLDIAERLQKSAPGVPIIVVDQFVERFRTQVLRSMEERDIRNIRFVPRIEAHRVMEYLNQATIGLSSPLNLIKNVKALPTKLFEYMAAGIPCVASNFPHVASVIKSTGCGILVPPENVEIFVESIVRLLNDPAEAYQMGIAGRAAFLERYNWESHAPKLQLLYEELSRKEGKTTSLRGGRRNAPLI